MIENKPITIDEIDVSECTHYSGGECLIDYYLLYGYEISHYGYCRDCKDCYFKQLARKTQECEQAEQKLEKIREIVNKLSLSINWNINKNAYEKLQSIIQIIDEVE